MRQLKVLVTGPESSGTSLVSRIFRQAGADVAHRSATYDGDFPNLRALALECDVAVVVFRDPFSTMASQRAQGFDALPKLRCGYDELFRALIELPCPLYILTYEQLVLNRHSIRPLLRCLGLNAWISIEQVRDENAKYLLESGLSSDSIKERVECPSVPVFAPTSLITSPPTTRPS